MSAPAQKDCSPNAVCAALNRLIIADRDEGLALGAAAHVVQGPGRRQRLLRQLLRRDVFVRDIANAIVKLGGVPATKSSYRAKMRGAARRIRQVLAGAHEGDAYAACARATERTSNAYTRALRSTLPAAIRFGVERELSEIEWDRAELGRLRFGARPASSPVENAAPEEGEAAPVRIRPERNDELALEAWNNEGGAVRSP